jgi:cytosine/adenosine deaminase-related metal-dependent hydrolase
LSDTVIRGALGILTGRTGAFERMQGDLRIVNGRIAAIGEVAAAPGDTVLDASGCVITPGLISTHHHLFQSVLKGVPAGIDSALEAWLRLVPYTHWHRLDEEALSVAAELGMVELLLSGCTAIADHHYLFSPTYDFDAAEILFPTAERLGMRLTLARGGSTQGRAFDNDDLVPMPVETLDAMIDHVARLAARYNDPGPDAMRRVVLAPTTPLWSIRPEEMPLVATAARAMNVRLHSHLSETRHYVDYSLQVHGMRPVEFVASHGWVGPDVWYAHLVHVDDEELAILAETGTGMAHCPQSNGRLGSGVAPADRFDKMGGRVSLGVDGAGSNEACDMVNEMHTAWLTHRAVKGAGAVRCEDVLRWATAGGAAVLGLDAVGKIEVGKSADIAVFDLAHPRYAGLHDPLIAPVASGGGAQVRHLLVAGRQVVVNGVVPGVDLARLSARATAVVRRVAAQTMGTPTLEMQR